MNSATKFLSRVLPLIFIMASTLTAAEAPVIVSARLHCLSLGDEDLAGLALIQGDGEYLPVVVPKNVLSPAYDYQGPELVSVVRTERTAPAQASSTTIEREAASPANVAGRFTLPAIEGEFLLLFATDPSGGLRIIPVDFSPQAIPAGHYLIWNKSGRRISFDFGNSKFVIDPDQSQLMTPGADPDTYVSLRVFDEQNTPPRLIVSGRQFNRANTRQVMLFLPSDNPSAPVDVRVITDQLPAEAE